MGEEIEAAGGEVLKFVGDAALAISPTAAADGLGNGAACWRAFEAARSFIARVEAENAERATAGALTMNQAMAHYVGQVAYGNMGAARRLDFTVIGTAVNHASRLVTLAKGLDRPLLVSETMAQPRDSPLSDLGPHALRGIPGRQRVFAPVRRSGSG